MSKLDEYDRKRKFGITPEPKGSIESPQSDELCFVVQQHAATRMHFDLRLEVAGTLRSWAVPEGPTLDPKVKKLAIRTEDHPIEYVDFEGVIPAGEYGAGKMIIWDRGQWVPMDEPETAINAGDLKFRLFGEKLRGGFMLKRLKKHSPEWLLIKERDSECRSEDEYILVKEQPESIVSGLLVSELTTEPKRTAKAKPIAPAKMKGAKKTKLPSKPLPSLPTLVGLPPVGGEWVHEIKFDGYRVNCVIENERVRIITRNGHDWTKKFWGLADAINSLCLKPCLIDGEAAVQDLAGRTDINLLQEALSKGDSHLITLFAFDIRHYDGYNVENCSLEERRLLLEWVLAEKISSNSALQLSEASELPGSELFARASALGLEGIVSKARGSTYEEGRTKSWLKTKSADLGTFLIVGVVFKQERMASLILVRERDDNFEFVGKAGSGLSQKLIADLHNALELVDAPCTDLPKIADAIWVSPTLEAEISHRGWTSSGMLRQPSVLSVKAKAKNKRSRPRLVSDRDLASIRITNPERKLFESDATKLDLAVYYARVGDLMLPHLLGRPVTLIRSPSGKADDQFYQRHAFEGLPKGVDKIHIPEKGDDVEYLVINEPVGFLSLAQYGVIEFHPWACRSDQIDKPDRLIIDLDPGDDVPRKTVVAAAHLVGDRFRDLGFSPYLRTTGGKGLHVAVAIARRHSWATFSEFAFAFVNSLTKDAPRKFTTSPALKDRVGKIYLDHLRNRKGSTAVSSYSARARKGVPIACPLEWSETRQLITEHPLTILNVLHGQKVLDKDPWTDINLTSTIISKAVQRRIGMKVR